MKINNFKVVFISLVLSMSSFANAGLISQTDNADGTNFFDDIVFNSFDTDLGTLTNVILDLSASLTVYIVDPSKKCNESLDCEGNHRLTINNEQSFDGFSLTDIEFVSNSQVDDGVFVNLAVSTLSYNFENLEGFVNGSSPRLSVEFIQGPYGNTDYSNQLSLATLTYQYNAVPEPSILVIFVLGIFSLVSRRFKKLS
jgi:hypothetical protein